MIHYNRVFAFAKMVLCFSITCEIEMSRFEDSTADASDDAEVVERLKSIGGHLWNDLLTVIAISEINRPALYEDDVVDHFRENGRIASVHRVIRVSLFNYQILLMTRMLEDPGRKSQDRNSLPEALRILRGGGVDALCREFEREALQSDTDFKVGKYWTNRMEEKRRSVKVCLEALLRDRGTLINGDVWKSMVRLRDQNIAHNLIDKVGQVSPELARLKYGEEIAIVESLKTLVFTFYQGVLGVNLVPNPEVTWKDASEAYWDYVVKGDTSVE